MKTFIALIQLMVLCPTKPPNSSKSLSLAHNQIQFENHRTRNYVRDLSRRRNDLLFIAHTFHTYSMSHQIEIKYKMEKK